ncbi:hypothetical protein IQ279_14235 [Streptomyces verrucosisporus]|uniref:hypothetical protein n=1 Tax=Streptomyces verrucosisporus TaxID=1695161 RepID=UPI0019D13558|nr:hypothetical protein [Streptomyces verrucosisporus]MBN3930780.1 hypothetical protein [Streptomyces verrucosisporus]
MPYPGKAAVFTAAFPGDKSALYRWGRDAVARRNGLTVLPYDGGFDVIAEITGQWTRWAAEPGSAH